MALVTCNVSSTKSSVRSAIPCFSRPEPLSPVYWVASSGEVPWMSDEEEEDDFPIPENAMDLDYNTFLNNLLVDGKSYALEIRMGSPQRLIRLQYEREDDDEGNGCCSAIYPQTWSCSNELSDINKSNCSEQRERKQDFVDNVDHCGCFKLNALQVTASYRSYVETIRSRAPTFFRNKLIDAICSPFSQSEYENLMVVARKRSPQVKLKHLRKDSIPYKTEVLGSSYFDYFPGKSSEIQGYVDADLAGEIDTKRSTTGYIYTIGDTAIS